MTDEERSLIQDLDKCDFGEIHAMHKAKVEVRRNLNKEEKLVRDSSFFPSAHVLDVAFTSSCQRLKKVGVDHLGSVYFFSARYLKVLKEANLKIVEEYGFCMLDNHKERIGNFKIEPPGLFRGRGEHPKQGMLKNRLQPEDVIINCSEWEWDCHKIHSLTSRK